MRLCRLYNFNSSACLFGRERAGCLSSVMDCVFPYGGIALCGYNTSLSAICRRCAADVNTVKYNIMPSLPCFAVAQCLCVAVRKVLSVYEKHIRASVYRTAPLSWLQT